MSSDESSEIEVCDLPSTKKTTHLQEEDTPQMKDVPVPSPVAHDKDTQQQNPPPHEWTSTGAIYMYREQWWRYAYQKVNYQYFFGITYLYEY